MLKKTFFITAVALASLGATAFELSSKSAPSCPLEGTPACPKVNCPLKDTPQCPFNGSVVPACCQSEGSTTLSLF
ncbi:MAG TPA: hypothetical protein PKJ63_07065 [Cyclobacteriaceae bacterium]|nr:hypothetical protein [Cyclobacteriaceae bacterium]